MKKMLFLTYVLLFPFFALEAKEKTICLNMIVKDESPVIERCLKSVKPYIDYWVIVDTGSTDGTQAIIKEFMKDMPGELHERPWVDFSHNRNEALKFAKGKADYLLLIDADEHWVTEPNFSLPKLSKDFYCVLNEVDSNGKKRLNKKIQLIDNTLDWIWDGEIFERLSYPNMSEGITLKRIKNIFGLDGHRCTNPHKYLDDAEIVKKILKREPNNPRWVFYLARCQDVSHQPLLAMRHYMRRVQLGDNNLEFFYSQYRLARLHESIGSPSKVIVKSYLKAIDANPSRLEPYLYLAYYLSRQGNNYLGYLVAKDALSQKRPDANSTSLSEIWMHEYGILTQFASCAYAIGKMDEAKAAIETVLSEPSLPESIRTWIETNLPLTNKSTLQNQDRSISFFDASDDRQIINQY